ncbi:glycosyltransferase [Haloglomus halophilum]|uniref:glycosyltransferase n=1 Tax=Haloglomus halophilum TaxID=2962672 RepID=UPI0020C9EAB3|nr:glycosyltransferase [Haloglomus halophilum]
MVYELKPPVGGSPGLLMFTHKERPYFFDSPEPLARRLVALKERYVLGLQWGAYHADVGDTPYVDFQMACPGTVDWAPGADPRLVELCSRDFTPARFRPMDVPQQWDVFSVGHPIDIKRYSELLDTVRECFDRGVDLDVLLICAVPEPPDDLGGYWDTEFFEQYEADFTDAEREHIDLGVPVEASFGDRPLHPIPNEVFPYLYNASRGFALFSREEGQSKVVHEALCCGTPVVVHEGLKGGGRDKLDATNSLQFGDVDEAADAFQTLAEGDAPSFDAEPLRRELVEAFTGPVFEERVREVYADLGRPYEGDLETTDLAFKLGSHTVTLPESMRSGNTNDLRSREAFVRFVDYKLDRTTPLADRATARRADAEATIDDLREAGPEAVAGRVLRAVDRQVPVPLHRTAARAYRRVTGDGTTGEPAGSESRS